MSVKSSTKNKLVTGVVSQIVGVVVDVNFPDGELPAIYNALTLDHDGRQVVLEVAQHLSESSVRAVALSSTDGLTAAQK
jgi:F-type H+/Na+-transporting ATPase subunit beta